MTTAEVGTTDAALYRRGNFIAGLARALCVALSLAAVLFLWSSPQTRPLPALAVGLAYCLFWVASWAWVRRHPSGRRTLKVVHDVLDALAVGAGAAFLGGLESPLWLFLYPHVVAVSVRGGLGYAMAMGLLDTLIVFALTLMTPHQPLGNLHALALLFCAFLGGTTSSYLHRVQGRLSEVNRELQAKNRELAETAALARGMQEDALSHLGRVTEAKARLEELDRLRSQYLRNVSHEFRTPLTVIRGYAEHLMTEGVPAEASLAEVMRILIESCDQLITMVDTLIEVSRIEQGGGPRILELRGLDLREVAAGSVEPLRGLSERKGITLALDFPREPLALQGDLSLLRHLVRNLVENALKYSSPGTRVVVRCRAEAEEAMLEVEDSGAGIPAEHLPRIFEKFYTVEGGLARRQGGAGVGLYLAREIARLHGGRIDVHSRPGRGSVVSVRLPRWPPGPRAQTAHA
jgi:signal transduction histidine kinase